MPLDKKFTEGGSSATLSPEDRADLVAQFKAGLTTVLYILGITLALVWLGLSMVLQVFTMPWKEKR